MIDFFSERIGVPYAYPRYSQIAVAEFIFGGMENTTATTLTDLVLLDERAALDHDVDGLVSHELAHQWWGDLLTCREWSEAWLNEGFATYFEYVWREHAKGRDEADLELLVDADGYLAEAGPLPAPDRLPAIRRADRPVRRPPVREGRPRAAHAAARAGRRGVLARDRALRRASTRTDRSRRATWRAPSRRRPGATSTSFFDQWIARPGHPELEGAGSGTTIASVGTLRLAQKQPITPEAPLFKFSAAVRFEVDGREHDERVSVARGDARVRVPPAGATDAGDLRSGRRRAQDDQAGEDRARCGGGSWRRRGWRSIASPRRARLAELPDPAGIAALAAALRGDDSGACGLRPRRALGQTRRDDARAALVAAARRQAPACPPRRRRRAGRVPGRRDGRARAGRRCLRRGDASYFVEAEAALALGRTRAAEALALLPALLDRPSFQDVIRSRAIEGLGKCGDERALPDHARRLARRARPGSPGGRSSRRWPSWRAAPASRAPRASSSRHGWSIATSACAARRPAALARLGSIEATAGAARRARRRAGRPGAPAHGGGDPRPRGGHPPERGDPPAARRGRAAARRDRQAARAPGPACRAARDARHAAPDPARRPRTSAPAPSPAAPAATAPSGVRRKNARTPRVQTSGSGSSPERSCPGVLAFTPDQLFSSATMSRAISRARGSSARGIEIAPTTGCPPPP